MDHSKSTSDADQHRMKTRHATSGSESVADHRSPSTGNLSSQTVTDSRSAQASPSGSATRPPADTRSTTDQAQIPESHLDPLGSFLVIKPVDETFSFRKVNVFWPSKQLQGICGTSALHIECLANGSMVVKTESRAQTQALLKTTEFCSKPVTVSLHHARNTTKGLIFAPELRHMTETEILDGLREERVCHVRRQTSFKDGQRRDTSLLVLTFETSELPSHLCAGHLRYDVRVFVPNPLRCFKCHRFGHGSNTCRQSARCLSCGEAPHEGTACASPLKCLSCGSAEHTANSSQCPLWKKEKEVCAIVAQTGVSYQQARRTVEARTPVQNKTYAQAAKITSVSCATQTDPIPALPPLLLLTPRASAPPTVSKPKTTSVQTLGPALTGRTGAPRGDPTPARSQSGRHPSPAAAGGTRPATSGGQRSAASARLPDTSPRPHHPPAVTEHRDAAPLRSRPAVRVSMGRSRSVSLSRTTPPGDGAPYNSRTGAPKCAGVGLISHT